MSCVLRKFILFAFWYFVYLVFTKFLLNRYFLYVLEPRGPTHWGGGAHIEGEGLRTLREKGSRTWLRKTGFTPWVRSPHIKGDGPHTLREGVSHIEREWLRLECPDSQDVKLEAGFSNQDLLLLALLLQVHWSRNPVKNPLQFSSMILCLPHNTNCRTSNCPLLHKYLFNIQNDPEYF
jgi:hypothetical protein